MQWQQIYEAMQKIYDVPQSVVTLLGIVVGVITLIVSLHRNRTLLRTQHTFNALLQMSFNERYQADLESLRPYFAGEVVLPKDLFDPSKDHKQLRTALLLLLNYYEFLAAGVRYKVLSEKILRADQKFFVFDLYNISKEFIIERRKKRDRPALYNGLEWLHERWTRN
jgi:hypothetical protein